jgi:hypothetical protein
MKRIATHNQKQHTANYKKLNSKAYEKTIKKLNSKEINKAAN